MFCSTYWVLGTCVLTRCHVVTDINYVDRGAAARAPLQSARRRVVVVFVFI